ncbi:uncharacterized protein LOC129725877 [Wyeomyia smithii]|uniref:uncharacterized protein LOC129725877 n=1 Tax=Wyeomyia smithii TaxID=174621 RepID=UPI002467D913|nr:uncharacterized protein LOC129725877 [Wyeomyia smithii]
METTYKYPCCDGDEQCDGSVQCERCEEWYHFGCAGVDDSIAEEVWFCTTCIGEDSSARQSLGAPGKTKIHPVVIEHQPAEGGTNKEVGEIASKEKASKSLRISRERAQDNSGCSESEQDEQISNDNEPRREIHEKVDDRSCSESGLLGGRKRWKKRLQLEKTINQIAEDDSDTAGEDVDGSICSLGTVLPEKRSTRNPNADELNNSKSSTSASKKHTTKSSKRSSKNGRPSFEKDDDNLESSMGEKDSDDEIKVEGPTRLKIASRQVFPRTLPKFYGAAEEWPVFISAYEHANQSCGFTNAENLVRLQEALRGRALETVRNRLLLPENVPLIIEKLRKRFGNPEILSTRLAKRIQQLDGPSSESLESVIEFGSAVEEFSQHLKAAGLVDHLKNPILMQSLVQKLPTYYAMEWVDYKRRAKTVDLEPFGAFMEGLVEKALEATFEKTDLDGKVKGKEKPKLKAFVHATDVGNQESQRNQKEAKKGLEQKSSNQQRQREYNCSVCQKPGHYGRSCQEFLKQSVEERWKTVKRLNLCPLCLYDHGQRSCRIRMRCKEDGCLEQHNTLLHSSGSAAQIRAQCNSHREKGRAVLFRMAPVTLHHGRKAVDVPALIDEGSSITMVDSEVVELLGADGPVEPLQMCWTNGVQRTENQSKKVKLEISAKDSPYRYDLSEVRTVSRLDLPVQQVDARELKQRFDYLKDIRLPSYKIAAPKVLIGIDNAHLIAPLESRHGDSGEPVAVRCNLGWMVYGPRPSVSSSVNFLGHRRCMCEKCSIADQRLDEALKQQYDLEEVGNPAIRLESNEDRRAREILETTTKRNGERFETGLLWRRDDVCLPESFDMAMKRLRSLEARINRNPGVRENLENQLEEYVTKGYAHRITKRELEETPRGKEWYLPLNYVVHQKKPDKVRLVWDAAAKAHGVSLNDCLLRGPDMVTSLPTVINGFREKHIAFGGDIREMYHQVKIRSKDQQAQRFLLPGPDGDVQIYVMDVVIFGASCSPCSAQYVKNLNA